VNSKGGVTTSYFIETEHLPLLLPLRIAGVPERLVAAIEEPLRRVVDAGYSRNDDGAVTVSSSSDLSRETAADTFTQTADAAVAALSEAINSHSQPDQRSTSRRMWSGNFDNPSPATDGSVDSDVSQLVPDTGGTTEAAVINGPSDLSPTGGSVVTSAADPSAAEPSSDAAADPPARSVSRSQFLRTAPDIADNAPSRFGPRVERVLTRLPSRNAPNSSTTKWKRSSTPTDNIIGSDNSVPRSAVTGAADGGDAGEK